MIIKPADTSTLMGLPILTIQSAHRPHHVAKMNAALAPFEPLWYVPADQASAYEAAGANVRPVLGELPMKPVQLNAALEDAFVQGRRVVTMDDDYESISYVENSVGSIVIQNVTLIQAIEALGRAQDHDPRMRIAGLTTTANAYWSRPGIRNYGMVTGQIMLHAPNVLRFDENLKMLEDLDYIIAHHVVHGGLAKLQDWMPNFHIFGRSVRSDKNYEGGYKDYRTSQLQADTIAYLQKKWEPVPGVVFNDDGLGKSVQSKIRWANLAAFSKLAKSSQNDGDEE